LTQPGSWSVRYHPAARAELRELPAHERKALNSAADKLAVLGPQLPFPHSSKVMGDRGGSLRELRPRARRSSWRAIYTRIADTFVIASIAPEAQRNKTGFDRAIAAAKARIAEVEP
jgi:hypothetical protein